MDSLPCTLIIPACGDSVRFQHKTMLPKGAIKFKWRGEVKSMVQHIVPKGWNGSVVLGCKREDAAKFPYAKNMQICPMLPTAGQAQTVRMMALVLLRAYTPATDLLVVNSDNAFDEGVLENFLEHCRALDAAVGAMVFGPTENFERYGYVDGWPRFTYGAEKKAISKFALAGAFYFKSAGLIVAHSDPRAAYLSEWFIRMPAEKVSYCIRKEALHEWGTAELLEADESVTVDWSNQ